MKAMRRAYDKNRTQMFSRMDELEIQAHELRNIRQKINVKNLGNITTVDREMEAIFDTFSQSGRIVKEGQSIENANLESRDLEKTTPRSQMQLSQRGRS